MVVYSYQNFNNYKNSFKMSLKKRLYTSLVSFRIILGFFKRNLLCLLNFSIINYKLFFYFSKLYFKLFFQLNTFFFLENKVIGSLIFFNLRLLKLVLIGSVDITAIASISIANFNKIYLLDNKGVNFTWKFKIFKFFIMFFSLFNLNYFNKAVVGFSPGTFIRGCRNFHLLLLFNKNYLENF